MIQIGWFQSSGSHLYTQVQPTRKIRHFGMDAEIQAMDGNKSVVQMLDSGDTPKKSHCQAGASLPLS